MKILERGECWSCGEDEYPVIVLGSYDTAVERRSFSFCVTCLGKAYFKLLEFVLARLREEAEKRREIT